MAPEHLPAPLLHRRTPHVAHRPEGVPQPHVCALSTPQAQASINAAPIPFSRYLEKHNRQDRMDTSRSALAVEPGRPEEPGAARAAGSGVARARVLLAYARRPVTGQSTHVIA